jgi:hypothetical protein
MASLFLVDCVIAGLLVPARTPVTSRQPAATSETV